MARPLDPYRTLELPRDATLDDVKAAYRRLAKLYHPDSAGERALPRFLAVQAAYEALTEGPGRLRAVIGSRPRPTTSSPGGPSTGRPRRSAADAEAARPAGPGTRGARGPAASGAGSPGARSGSRAGAGAGSPGSSGPSPGGGTTGPRDGSSRARGPAGPRPRRTRRAPGSTSYDGADSEPFEPEWQGASWYGGSSGTYWTINPREFADPRKHGPEYLARGRADARDRADAQASPGHDRVDGVDGGPEASSGSSRGRRARPGDGRRAGRPGAPGTDGAMGAAARAAGGAGAPDRGADAGTGWAGGAPFADGDRWPGRWAGDPADPGPGAALADDVDPWPTRRARGTDLSAAGLVALALLALAFVAVLYVLIAVPEAPGAASVVPVVAFCGIAIVVLVRVLRREGRRRA